MNNNWYFWLTSWVIHNAILHCFVRVLKLESKFYEHLNKVIEIIKTNSTWIGESKYYEIMNYLKQLELENKFKINEEI